MHVYSVYVCRQRELYDSVCVGGGLVEDKVEHGVSSLGMCVCWGYPAAESPSPSSEFKLLCCFLKSLVFVVCVCGLVEDRVFLSEVSVRSSARSHWQRTAMLN